MVTVTLKTAETGEIVRFEMAPILLVEMVNRAMALINSDMSGFLTDIGMF